MAGWLMGWAGLPEDLMLCTSLQNLQIYLNFYFLWQIASARDKFCTHEVYPKMLPYLSFKIKQAPNLRVLLKDQNI